MFYPLPKKIQLASSQAKWALESRQSVLLLVDLEHLSALDAEHAVLQHIQYMVKRAKALEIPIIKLKNSQDLHSMMTLGELVNLRQQVLVAGYITAQTKQCLAYLRSVTPHLCVVNDAIYLTNLEQHIQYIASVVEQQMHHMNCYSVLRLWSLSAPRSQILSSKGVLLAIAEHLALEPLEIDPDMDLRILGLDSVAMVSLVGLWRANGAEINYEAFQAQCSVKQLLQLLNIATTES